MKICFKDVWGKMTEQTQILWLACHLFGCCLSRKAQFLLYHFPSDSVLLVFTNNNKLQGNTGCKGKDYERAQSKGKRGGKWREIIYKNEAKDWQCKSNTVPQKKQVMRSVINQQGEHFRHEREVCACRKRKFTGMPRMVLFLFIIKEAKAARRSLI